MPPVIRAETFYTPPPHLDADVWTQVPAAELVIEWFEQRAQRRVPRPTETVHTSWFARIDAGRWIAECTCGSAQVISPTDPRFYCVICYTGWVPLTVPDDIDATEAAVSDRPTREQFWWHPEDPARPRPPVIPPGPDEDH
ncbi:hypothetical protein [Streptomyces sp. NBRC 109706]|uniref:hypothetical protein n=1 Tax=Streptomyces sp. NBRC 109706 TaxID=1550035 RepID=UPI000781DCFC|nr:hypothetical protein [Streptomyces sp. NBRC 109706]